MRKKVIVLSIALCVSLIAGLIVIVCFKEQTNAANSENSISFNINYNNYRKSRRGNTMVVTNNEAFFSVIDKNTVRYYTVNDYSNTNSGKTKRLSYITNHLEYFNIINNKMYFIECKEGIFLYAYDLNKKSYEITKIDINTNYVDKWIISDSILYTLIDKKLYIYSLIEKSANTINDVIDFTIINDGVRYAKYSYPDNSLIVYDYSVNKHQPTEVMKICNSSIPYDIDFGENYILWSDNNFIFVYDIGANLIKTVEAEGAVTCIVSSKNCKYICECIVDGNRVLYDIDVVDCKLSKIIDNYVSFYMDDESHIFYIKKKMLFWYKIYTYNLN